MKQFSEKGFRGRNALREMPVVGHDQKLDFGQRPHSQLAADVADGLRQNLLQRFGRFFHRQFFAVDPRERKQIFDEPDRPVGFRNDIPENFFLIPSSSRGLSSKSSAPFLIVVNGVRKSWEILRSSVASNCSFSAADFSFIRSTQIGRAHV